MLQKTHFQTAGMAWDSRILSLVMAVVLALILCDTAKANLIVNGGFENGDFTGWTLSGNTDRTTVSNALGSAQSGAYGAALGTIPGQGFASISQTLALTAGETYIVHFWLQNAGAGFTGNVLPNAMLVTLGGKTLLNVSDAAASGYQEYTYTPLASGTSTLLFSFRQDPASWFLDDVSVNPAPTNQVGLSVPESGNTASLMGLAILGLAAARKKLISPRKRRQEKEG